MATNHDTLIIEREFSASPEQFFRAFSLLEERAKWFRGPDGWVEAERTLDCRTGGLEFMKGTFKDGSASSYSAHFYDVVPNERLIYSFDVVLNGVLFSASLATLEISPCDVGTKMRFTEQLTYVDNPDAVKAHENRYIGTNWGFDNLANYLNSQ